MRVIALRAHSDLQQGRPRERNAGDIPSACDKTAADEWEAGIIDPTMVIRIALENAVSVASVLLLAEATMTEVSETKKEAVAT